MREIYHSALKPEMEIKGELDYYESNGSVVLQRDIIKCIHPTFWNATAIYSEPAWRSGYQKFLSRAGRDGNFNDYLDAIGNTVFRLGIPSYIVIGSHMKKRLHPEGTIPIKLHGYKCLLAVWNACPPEGLITNYDALNYVADHHFNVLDFSCGYGNTARAMLSRGKKFICSDINTRCVYYIATEIMGYEPDNIL